MGIQRVFAVFVCRRYGACVRYLKPKRNSGSDQSAFHIFDVSETMSHIVEINCIEELEDYRLAWNALLNQTHGASFFQSLDWLQAYWRHFEDEQTLRVLLVCSGSTPIGILPLTIVREKTKIGALRVLTYPLHDWGSFFGPIGPNPTATLLASMRHVRDTQRDWDMLDLRWIDRDEVDRGRTATAITTVGFSCHDALWKETAVIDMTNSWEEYFASRTSKFRNNVRRSIKRVERLGRIRFDRYRPLGSSHGDDDPRWDLYDACVDLASRSWQGNSTTGTTISHPGVRDFLRDVHGAAARAGALDLAVITLNDRPIAFGYNYFMNGRVFGLRVGSAPEYAKLGLGTVLYENSFRDSFERGDDRFDLGTGSLKAKRTWCTSIRRSYRCTHYPLRSPRVQLLRMKHWMQRRWASPTALEPA